MTVRTLISFVAIACLLVPRPSAAQNGAFDDRLAERLAETRTALDLPAIGGAIGVRGDVVAQVTQGTRIAGKDLPVGDDAYWHIGSISKSVTGTLAGILVEDGALRWDTTVGEVFGEAVQASWRPVTLTELMTHRSGADANFSLRAMFADDPSTAEAIMIQRRAQVMKVLARPNPGPRGTFRYSNTGVVIAGAMLEEVTGRPWRDLVTEKVFAPIGVTPTFGAPQGERDPWGHRRGLFGRRGVDPSGKADNPHFIGPAGTVALTLNGLVRYGHAHASRDPQLLSPEGWAKLHDGFPSDIDGAAYAFGWAVVGDGWDLGDGPVYWHNGSNTMWYALLVFVPETETVIALVTNEADLETVQPAFFDLAKGLLAETRAAADLTP